MSADRPKLKKLRVFIYILYLLCRLSVFYGGSLTKVLTLKVNTKKVDWKGSKDSIQKNISFLTLWMDLEKEIPLIFE